jgi:hypothetical protein
MARLASGQVAAHAEEILPGMPKFSIQHNFGESPGKATQSHPKPHQSHIKATQSHLKATPKPPKAM